QRMFNVDKNVKSVVKPLDDLDIYTSFLGNFYHQDSCRIHDSMTEWDAYINGIIIYVMFSDIYKYYYIPANIMKNVSDTLTKMGDVFSQQEEVWKVIKCFSLTSTSSRRAKEEGW